MSHKTPLHFNALHVYRAILREATYHPDPHVRSYLRSYARDSFRTQKINFAIEFQDWTSVEKGRRETSLMRNARNFCQTIRRANDGYLNPFQKTLSLTYGRTGARRRQIMSALMAPATTETPPSTKTDTNTPSTLDKDQAPHDQILLSTSQDSLFANPLFPGDVSGSTTPPEPNTFDSAKVFHETTAGAPRQSKRPLRKPFSSMSSISETFRALTAAQSAASAYVPSQTRRITITGPNLPSTTIWKRPLTPKRIRNATKKWYAKTAQTLYPPLPTTEWEYIRSIAAGVTRLEPKSRRPQAAVCIFTTVREPWKEPLRGLLDEPEKVARYEGKKMGNPHLMTPRWLQHRYEWLLRHTPVEVAPVAQENSVENTEQPETSFLGSSQEQEEGRSVGPKESNPQTNPNAKPKDKGKRTAFLWDSTVVDRARPLRVKPDGEMRKALFE
ncbi:uncharacterized protein HMPREF1541_07436 [Cyphellophora europaea CBS 101466]|uniref:LYR motif-containing protein Cup1-like N-terminal domain-containing protein n=1 Tax=Cyphellophora europaea (strain CBS 101466) TaxID=1220924 RepID=W2RQ25_CYPE1|nr:uncharacterized protein HMPREF1541_07436 [Cyphellophora europaea CBS 101466]ETN37813.1 hypothetical protein HMPREF1541_07436 [Cyphellophora europaea CBS 101466]